MDEPERPAATTEILPTDATKREGAAERERAAHEVPAYFEKGAPIGRYIVLERLGEGGMGVVYSAYDPELDRKVAIKLLQGNADGSHSVGGDQAWLLREAQALARLSHPNVVAVHDVGTLPGHRVFVAMEQVDGQTLRRWYKEKPRTVGEVLHVMIAAGHGLAAAHAAGLVHRDFKPDNVLVGNDERVRVMDFGLARLRPTASVDVDTGPVPRPSDLQIDSKSPLSEELTAAGAVIGTPAYMAPEVFQGARADALTDQFAFGVTLFEALYRTRPFVKEQLMSAHLKPPQPSLPESRRVPARIERAVLRAISIDPKQRFASMDELLTELGRVAKRETRVALIVGATALVALGAGGFYFGIVRHDSEPCQAIDERLAGVWDPGTKEKVRAGFRATKRSYADKAFAQLEASLDKYAADWTKTATESCRATRVRGEQSEDVLSLRTVCLDERLHELRTLAQALTDPHPLLLDKADKIGSELQPIEMCSNIALLRAPDQPAPEHRAKVAELGKQIAEARAQVIAGRFLPALVAAGKIEKEAQQINYGSYVSESAFLRGTALMATGNAQDSVDAFRTAVSAGIRSRRDDIVMSASLSNAMSVAEALGKPPEARLWYQLGVTAAQRMGGERIHEIRLNMVLGLIEALSGNHEAAITAHERSFLAAQRDFGKDNSALWHYEILFATTLTKAQHYARAAPHFEHALTLREKVVGTDHPEVALVLSNLGACYRAMGENKKARAAFERSLGMREKLFGKQSPLLVPTLVNFAEYLATNEKQPLVAMPLIERAHKLAKGLPGEEHPSYHETATTYAQVLGLAGRVAEARKLSDEVMAIETRVKSITLPTTQSARAELEADEQQWAEAVKFAEAAIAGFEQAGGVENSELPRPLTALARAKIGLKDPPAAKAALERAIAIGTKANMGEYLLADARRLLAEL